MKTVILYKAEDGKTFTTKKQCAEYEKANKEINIIMQNLCPIPTSCAFINGEGYILQDKSIVDKAKKELLELGKKFFKQDSENWTIYSIGRLFDDSGYRNFYTAWGRLNNIDKYYREWGQGYYAVNPEKGIQKCLNK